MDAFVQWWVCRWTGWQEGRKRITKAGTDADMLDEQREEADTDEAMRCLGKVN